MTLGLIATPVEVHDGVFVKREDMCFAAVPISKARGAAPHIASRPEATIAVVDTYRSLNGLVTAAVCAAIGKKCVVFRPRYVSDPGIAPHHLRARDVFGAVLREVPAGRQRVMNALARREYPDAYFMPPAFRLLETSAAAAAELTATLDALGPIDSLVVPVGTGTHLSGLLVGARGRVGEVVAVLGYTTKLAGLPEGPPLRVIDRGYGYRDRDDWPTPFPASPFYEMKAWRWLCEHRPTGRVLFWNIGAPCAW